MDKPTTTVPTAGKKQHPKPSTSELLSSAKLVASAAKSKLAGGKDSDNQGKVDKAKVAGAAADILNAASSYGHFEQKGYGKYVDKAEDYLHKYHTTNTTTTTTGGSGHSGKTQTTTTTHSSTHSDGKEHKSGSGYGEYVKIAEGFLKKH